MTQQFQKSPGAVLYDNYSTEHAAKLSSEQIQQLLRYCSGIINHPEENAGRRLDKAKQILIAQSHKAPNIPPALLSNKKQQQLDTVVGLIEKIVQAHPDKDFIDSLARNLVGALWNEQQSEGALKALLLEQICGAAIPYVASGLELDRSYTQISLFFMGAAQLPQHRAYAFKVLGWATEKQNLAANAAVLLNSLADRYSWSVGIGAVDPNDSLAKILEREIALQEIISQKLQAVEKVA